MGDPVGEGLVRERELDLRIPAGDVLAVGARRLGEAIVYVKTAAASLPVEHTVDRPLGPRRSDTERLYRGRPG